VVSGKKHSYMLTLSSLSNRFIVKDYCENILVNAEKSEKYLSKRHDLVLKNAGDFTISYINEDDIILPSFVHILRIEDENIRNFVFMRLSSNDFVKFISKKNGDSLMKRMNLNDLKEFELGDFTHQVHLLSSVFFAQEQLGMLYYDLVKYNDLKKQYFIEYGGSVNE
jgi:hypothetical protein